MVQINFARKEINCKIVYYGPGLSGKTTNLEQVHERAPMDNRGDLTSISTDGDRTLFFDFMPLDLGTIAGMRTKFHIYTVPGQVYYNSTRKLVLLGADGIIFVADSSPNAMDANKQSLENLRENLAEMGKDLGKTPLVMQWNKRDVPDAIDIETLEKELNPIGVPSLEAVASKGDGVIQTLKSISSLVLESINSNERAGALVGGGGAGVEAAKPAAQPAPAQVVPGQGAATPAAAQGGESLQGMQVERNEVGGAPGPGQVPQDQMAAAAAQQGPAATDQPAASPQAQEVAAPQQMRAPVSPTTGSQTPQQAPPQRQPATRAGTQTATMDPAADQKPGRKPIRQATRAGGPVVDRRQAAEIQPATRPASAAQGVHQVIGGKPKGKKKSNNALGIIVIVGVVVLLIGAAAAYFLMLK
jgi:signal recognition particle receptor subunit beta